MTDELHKILPRTAQVITDGIARGQHRGVQLSISSGGVVIADSALGTSWDDQPLGADTLMPWLSAGKPLTAVCVLRIIESGELSLETPVANVISEFARTSRDVTLWHLLTHTAGLNPVATGWPESSWQETINTICEAGLVAEWIPGERAAYDPVRSWFLLGEIVRRIDGRPIEQVLREDVLLPIGMDDSWLAMSAGQHAACAERIGRTEDIRGPNREPTSTHLAKWCTSPSPGSSFRGPMRDLRTFYEVLLAGGVTSAGTRILQASTIEEMTQRQRVGMYDETFRHHIDFGLGVIINSNRYGAETVPYGFGPSASERAWGHGGARSCIGFADPERQLVVCLVFNGYLTEPQHHRRMQKLLPALEEDLQAGQTGTTFAPHQEGTP